MKQAKPIKVLLADDHKIFREGVVALLQDHNFIEIVGEAGYGEAVIEYLYNEVVDVVLLDIKLPDMNGMDVAQIIKERYPDIKILVFTSYDEERYIFKMLEIGVNGYVLKTAGSNEMVTAIQTVNAGNNYSSEAVAEKVRQYFIGKPKEEGYVQLTNREKRS